MPEPCCHSRHDHAHPPRRRLGAALRFAGWFVGFSGLYAMSAVCPFCGRPGCPVGAASAGMVGVVCAGIMQWGRSCRLFLVRLVRPGSST